MKDITRQLIDAYEMRVQTVKSLMDQTSSMFMEFQKEIQEMLETLRQNLAKSESLRKADFDRMIDDILSRRLQTCHELEMTLLAFHQEEGEMIRTLRNMVEAPDGSSQLTGISKIHQDIVSRQQQREQDIMQIIKRFQIEQEDLKSGLKILIARGETVRTNDFRGMLKTLRVQENDYDGLIPQFMDHFQEIRSQLNVQWQGLDTP